MCVCARADGIIVAYCAWQGALSAADFGRSRHVGRGRRGFCVRSGCSPCVAGKRKPTARQEALRVDGAKVLRTIVMAAMKRRLPQAVARMLRQKMQTESECGKRKRGDAGDEQKGKRLAMRAGPLASEHVCKHIALHTVRPSRYGTRGPCYVSLSRRGWNTVTVTGVCVACPLC